MRKHGIISMAAWVAGFAQETDADYWRTLRQLISYDPDQVQALYATPHSWTPFAVQEGEHRVVQTDMSRWDYKHQVLESANVPNWRVLLWVKFIEAACQLRPKSLRRVLVHPDRLLRAGMRWYSNIGRRVWVYEIWQWLFYDRRTNRGPKLVEFLKRPWLPNAIAKIGAKLPQPWNVVPDPLFLSRVEKPKLAAAKAKASTQS
jgi:anaerobic magnesium-protoporphyrin IX monomethyl ester cyclase